MSPWGWGDSPDAEGNRSCQGEDDRSCTLGYANRRNFIFTSYRPEFGSDLSRYAFENVDTTLRTLIRQEVIAALRKWEPRIFNIQVTFEQNLQEGALLVNISYEILSTGASAQVSVPLNIL